MRGVPLDAAGYFFLPLWTDFQLGAKVGILDWYTVLVGVTSLVVLASHGALWVAYKTENDLQQRAHVVASRLWWAQAALTAVITLASFYVQPHLASQFAEMPWGYIFPAIALAGLVGMKFADLKSRELLGFLSSSAYIIGMLTSAVFGVFPYVLPAWSNPSLSLTISNSAAPEYGLKVGLVWWIIGMILAVGYVAYIHRMFAGKVKLEEEAG